MIWSSYFSYVERTLQYERDLMALKDRIAPLKILKQDCDLSAERHGSRLVVRLKF
jgi:hypothetical protein